jgi:tRNA(Arg) A34 adenosine deaminase TadA
MEFTLDLPAWAVAELNKLPEVLPTVEAQMAEVIRFSRLNIEHNTGGPFAAGVFERDTGRRLVIGVNRVVPRHCSSAHAEVMALSLAQHLLGTFDLGGPSLPAYQLVVNWRPCAMCFGATIWSGVRSLVIAGGGPELERITGFDEGPIHPDWRDELARRGISLQEGVLEAEAIAVFHQFAASGALVYNGRLGS